MFSNLCCKAIGLLWVAVLACILSSSGYGDEQASSGTFLARKPVDDFQLRVLCWNVRANSIFPPDGPRCDSFERIVKAVDPDVICLQEVFDPSNRLYATLTGLLDGYLPLMAGLSWQIHTASDNVVLSRFPIRHGRSELVVPFPLPGVPDFHYGHAMCLIDVPAELCESDFYVVAMHNKSRGGNSNVLMRERQSDAIVSVIRQLVTPGHEHAIVDRTPLLIIGDMNVLAVEPEDAAHHLTTLLTGNIVDEQTFGPDFPLDWDGTRLVEVKPRHNSREEEFYTWREDDLPFPPGALDRMIYTDSVLILNHSFVLNTTQMTAHELRETGLLATDVLWKKESGNYDHLPLVADFSIRASRHTISEAQTEH